MFWRSNGETLSDRATIFIEDSSLIFLQLDVVIVYWGYVECPEFCEELLSAGRFYYRQSWLFRKSNGEFFSNCSKIFTGVLPLTVHCFERSDLRLELYSISRKFMNVVYFSSNEILELFFINFNLLIFLGHFCDRLRIRNQYVLLLILWDSLYLCFGISEIFTVPWVFCLYWEVFPTLIISVDLFFCFQLHIGFV